jgi:hypothetical protein
MIYSLCNSNLWQFSGCDLYYNMGLLCLYSCFEPQLWFYPRFFNFVILLSIFQLCNFISIWRSRLPCFSISVVQTEFCDWKKIKRTTEKEKRTRLPSFLPAPRARRPTPLSLSLSRTNPQDGVERWHGRQQGGARVSQVCAAGGMQDGASYGLRTCAWLLSPPTPHRGRPQELGGMLHPSPADAAAPRPRIDKQSHKRDLLHRRSEWALALPPPVSTSSLGWGAMVDWWYQSKIHQLARLSQFNMLELFMSV